MYTFLSCGYSYLAIIDKHHNFFSVRHPTQIPYNSQATILSLHRLRLNARKSVGKWALRGMCMHFCTLHFSFSITSDSFFFTIWCSRTAPRRDDELKKLSLSGQILCSLALLGVAFLNKLNTSLNGIHHPSSVRVYEVTRDAAFGGSFEYYVTQFPAINLCSKNIDIVCFI